jgi:hypothetical protein
MTVILTYATTHDLTAYARVTRVPNHDFVVIRLTDPAPQPDAGPGGPIPHVATLRSIPLDDDELVTWEDAEWQ